MLHDLVQYLIHAVPGPSVLISCTKSLHMHVFCFACATKNLGSSTILKNCRLFWISVHTNVKKSQKSCQLFWNCWWSKIICNTCTPFFCMHKKLCVHINFVHTIKYIIQSYLSLVRDLFYSHHQYNNLPSMQQPTLRSQGNLLLTSYTKKPHYSQ